MLMMEKRPKAKKSMSSVHSCCVNRKVLQKNNFTRSRYIINIYKLDLLASLLKSRTLTAEKIFQKKVASRTFFFHNNVKHLKFLFDKPQRDSYINVSIVIQSNHQDNNFTNYNAIIVKKKRQNLMHCKITNMKNMCRKRNCICQGGNLISVLFLFFSYFYFFNGNIYFEIMTVEFPRLFPLQSGLDLCNLAKVLLIHKDLHFLKVHSPKRSE